MHEWRRITFRVDPADRDDLLVCLHEEGTLGVEEEPGLLRAYFPAGVSGARLAGALARRLGPTGPPVRLESDEPVQDGFWHERWMAGLRPFELARRFFVIPGPATAPAPEGRMILRLTPGRAFGTGEHATTRMCVEMLEEAVRPGDSLLDVGTGTGILAIAALKLGAREAVAIDVDPHAASAAALNARLNDSPRIACAAAPLEALRARTFDLVAANLTGVTLCRLMTGLARLTGREAILSGLMAGEEREVTACAAGEGLQPVQRLACDEWVCLRMKAADD